MVACQAAQKIIDIRSTLCMMGIPLNVPSWMFGNNDSVITSTKIPHFTLNKCHNALSFHCVRECIASKIVYLLQCSGNFDLTDLLTKPLGLVSFWLLVKPPFFWNGDTIQDLPFSLPIQGIKADPPIGSREVTNQILT
jgi:hypothetical protein